MNITKNMEAILVVTIALASVTGAASAGARAHHYAPARASVQQQVSVESGAMTVVTISAKRLTAAEKAAL